MTIKSIVTKSLICSAVALATVASASANYRYTYRAGWNEIQDRYCLQGTEWGYPGSCQFSTYIHDQCVRYSCLLRYQSGIWISHQQREWILNYGEARHF